MCFHYYTRHTHKVLDFSLNNYLFDSALIQDKAINYQINDVQLKKLNVCTVLQEYILLKEFDFEGNGMLYKVYL